MSTVRSSRRCSMSATCWSSPARTSPASGWVVCRNPLLAEMMAISLLALLANAGGMALIAKHRHGGLHMQASWIFTSTDVFANVGVVLAGLLVAWTGSPLPDLVVGLVIGVVVLLSAVKILRLSNRRHTAVVAEEV